MKPQDRQITSCLGRAGQHARPSHKHCKACAKHAHAPPLRARTRWYKFHQVELSNRTSPVQWNNKLKHQRDGRRWNCWQNHKNDKLRVAWEGLDNTPTHHKNTAMRSNKYNCNEWKQYAHGTVIDIIYYIQMCVHTYEFVIDLWVTNIYRRTSMYVPVSSCIAPSPLHQS